tara:strand:+ start:519 stop:1079 length:561 start_codon:yes stop_codon:yes gene_type:complete
MNLEASKKIKFLEEKGMKTNDLEFDQLELVYNIIINNENSTPLIENNKYQKISWEGNDQLQIFLDMISKFKVCKKIKQNSNSLEIIIYSIFEDNDSFYIHLKPQIILKKIKKRCDFFLTSDRWITDRKSLDSESTIIKEPFKFKSSNKYKWIGDLSRKSDLENLRKICSLVLNDHMTQKGFINGIF